MKVKLLALSLLISTNVFATEVLNPGVTLLSHEEFRGERLPDKLVNMPQTNSASVTASANYSSAMHGSNVYASGYVSAILRNSSSSTQVYYVDKYMCIENADCFHTRDTYQLLANASQSINSNITTSGYMPNKGNFQDEATISISGYESTSAKGTNTVYIY